jgi:phosphoserine phosphatase
MLSAFRETWFYSDSVNDLPLLERVTHPVAVDAAPALAEIARRRGWRTLTLR